MITLSSMTDKYFYLFKVKKFRFKQIFIKEHGLYVFVKKY